MSETMRQRSFVFLVVCLLMFYGKIIGQKITGKNISFPQNQSVKSSDSLKNYWKTIANKFALPDKRQPTPGYSAPAAYSLRPPVPINFYSKQLSFFCKKELQVEKITSISLRLRIGSLEYVNYLEQKPNALKQY
ncbi:MAG TPA: hypothetical protein VF487_17640 [Chitinophagaceae bacterium]